MYVYNIIIYTTQMCINVYICVYIYICTWNINNLRYANNTTLMEESEKELKSLLMKVKEESEKTGLILIVR